MESRVCAVIVTYNRKDYLHNLLDALMKQKELNGIFILDNHGTDGTHELLLDEVHQNKLYIIHREDKEIFYYRNDENEGGAGGFKKAIRLAMDFEWDYLWIMDDDVLPEKDCLKQLLDGIDEKHKLCIPNRTDERFEDYACVKYNLTNPFMFRMKSRVKNISCKRILSKYVDVRAMPFEGPLISADIVKRVGYPESNYFIIYDDSDYCRRCMAYTQPRMVLGAVLHKQIIPNKEDAFSWKRYYAYRNCFAFDHRYGKNWLVRNLRPRLISYSLMLLCKIRKETKHKMIINKAYEDYKNCNMGKTVTKDNFEAYIYDSSGKQVEWRDNERRH